MKTPVPTSMVPTVGAELLHVPPAVVLVSESVPETQIDVPPAIGAGSGLTVNAMTRKQPDGKVYVIVVVPPVSPDTRPVVAPIEAIPGNPLFHSPPAGAEVSVTVPP